jgi:hypothetical protein
MGRLLVVNETDQVLAPNFSLALRHSIPRLPFPFTGERIQPELCVDVRYSFFLTCPSFLHVRFKRAWKPGVRFRGIV